MSERGDNHEHADGNVDLFGFCFAEAQQAGGYCAMAVGAHIFSFGPPKRGMVMPLVTSAGFGQPAEWTAYEVVGR